MSIFQEKLHRKLLFDFEKNDFFRQLLKKFIVEHLPLTVPNFPRP